MLLRLYLLSGEQMDFLALIYLKWSEVKWSESHSVVSNSLRLHGQYSPWNSPGQNTGVDSLSLFQGIFPTQGLNPGLPYCRRILYQLSHKGSPNLFEEIIICWRIYRNNSKEWLHTTLTISRESSWPRAQIWVSCIEGRFFTIWATKETHS